MKKVLYLFGGILGGIILLFNICWVWNYCTYNKYKDEGLDELQKFFTYAVLEEGFIYNVNYPFYLSFTGNLCVATEDSRYVLIIWPYAWKETEYGVMITGEDDRFVSIEIDRNLVAEDPEFQQLVDENREHIEELFRKGEERWGQRFE